MPDVTADAAGLRTAMRDDIARAMVYDATGPAHASSTWHTRADRVVVMLEDRYDLDAWLAHLAATRRQAADPHATSADVETQGGSDERLHG